MVKTVISTHSRYYPFRRAAFRGALSCQRTGRASGAKHRAVDGLLHLGDLAIRIIDIGRGQSIRDRIGRHPVISIG